MELMIGERIKKYRKEREMTQEALAQALSLSPQSVSKWECGDGYPDITLLPALANFFEVTVDELIGNDEISAAEDIQNNYFNVVDSLSSEESLKLSLKYHKKYPRHWHIANALMYEITRYHREKIDEYKPMLEEICDKILKECTDSVIRRNAIESMCMVCDEEEITNWIKKDTAFWYNGRNEIREKRYKLTGEEEKYWSYRYAGNFLHVSLMIGRLNEHKSYIGDPKASIAWNTMYLNILDGITQNSIPDGWICEYNLVLCRLSAAHFGSGNKKAGYKYREKALELNKRWKMLQDKSPLELGNPLFFGETKLVKNDYHIQLPDGSMLFNFNGMRYVLIDLADIMNTKTGWEWFDQVRNEEHWNSILKEANELIG